MGEIYGPLGPGYGYPGGTYGTLIPIGPTSSEPGAGTIDMVDGDGHALVELDGTGHVLAELDGDGHAIGIDGDGRAVQLVDGTGHALAELDGDGHTIGTIEGGAP